MCLTNIRYKLKCPALGNHWALFESKIYSHKRNVKALCLQDGLAESNRQSRQKERKKEGEDGEEFVYINNIKEHYQPYHTCM